MATTDELSGIAAAVVRQALEDARPGGATQDRDRQTALHFLLGDSPGWADSRHRWFALANVNEPSRAVLRRAVDYHARRLNAVATRLGTALDRQGRDATTRRETAAA